MGHGLKRGSTVEDPSIVQATAEKMLKLEPMSLEECIIRNFSATWFYFFVGLSCLFVFWEERIGVNDSFKDTANNNNKKDHRIQNGGLSHRNIIFGSQFPFIN